MRQSLLKSFLGMAMMVLTINMVYSQGVTTSSMTGQVLDNTGETLPGANVVATHMPSGTRYGAVTNIQGRYTIPGMRIGGPYTVSVSFIGFETQIVENINLSLGVAANVNVTMTEEGQLLSEVIITGEKNSVFSSDRTGAVTAIDNETINRLPTINRSINDFTRLTPQASGGSFAGQDSRLNNITVDGSMFNNSFGLGNSNLPGGRTGVAPISLDAIDQVSVNVAPYDVRQANFTGAGINAVTRSGTNEFTGSAYYFWRGSDNVGTRAKDNSFNAGDFNYRQVGFRVGGPIIKDKLFFFASFEDDKETTPGTTFRSNSGGEPVGGNVTRVLRSDLNQLSSFLRNNFGYETGPFEDYDHNTVGTRFLVKLDYNINDNNKLSVRYNHLDSETDVLASNSSSLGFGGRRTNLNALNFQNTNYSINENIRSVIAELNTRIGQDMTNNLIVGYTFQDESRGTRGEFFPLVDILQGGNTYTSFGFEPFTPNNELRYGTFQIQNNLQIFKGKHTITAGFNLERYWYENVFFPGSQSVYVFNSLEDFYADAQGFLDNPNRTTSDVDLRRFQVRWSNIPGQDKPLQPTRVTYMGLYGQDEIAVNRDFNLTIGLRIDLPFFDDTGFRNQEVEGLTFRDPAGVERRFRTDELPGANLLWSPRIGFNYDLSQGAKTTQLRGGTGIFTGRPVFVWISNQIGNNGILTGFERIDSNQDNPLLNRPFHPDPNRYKPTNVTGAPADRYELALTEPTFKFPQVWRSNIAIDQRLPGGIIGTAEFIYNTDVNGVAYYNANLSDPSTEFNGVDTRPRWTEGNRINGNIDNAVVLTNQNVGNSWVGSISLERPFRDGLYAKVAYSYGESRNLIDPGSIAFGSWNNNPHNGNPNNPQLGFSSAFMGHNAFATISYTKDIFEFGETSFSLFWSARTQGVTSYVYSGDLNGDGGFSNDLIYIPANINEMNFETFTQGGRTFTAAEQAAAWEAYIQQDKYLSANRGKIAERNGVVFPMIYQADFSASQTLRTTGKGKLEFRVDILNVGNLLNNNWGVGNQIIQNRPVIARGADAEGRAVHRLAVQGGELLRPQTFQSSAFFRDVWRLQWGLRFTF